LKDIKKELKQVTHTNIGRNQAVKTSPGCGTTLELATWCIRHANSATCDVWGTLLQKKKKILLYGGGGRRRSAESGTAGVILDVSKQTEYKARADLTMRKGSGGGSV